MCIRWNHCLFSYLVWVKCVDLFKALSSFVLSNGWTRQIRNCLSNGSKRKKNFMDFLVYLTMKMMTTTMRNSVYMNWARCGKQNNHQFATHILASILMWYAHLFSCFQVLLCCGGGMWLNYPRQHGIQTSASGCCNRGV